MISCLLYFYVCMPPAYHMVFRPSLLAVNALIRTFLDACIRLFHYVFFIAVFKCCNYGIRP